MTEQEINYIVGSQFWKQLKERLEKIVNVKNVLKDKDLPEHSYKLSFVQGQYDIAETIMNWPQTFLNLQDKTEG